MNDTTRQVTGLLGVAVIGSVMSSGYTSAIGPALTGLPPGAAASRRRRTGAGVEPSTMP